MTRTTADGARAPRTPVPHRTSSTLLGLVLPLALLGAAVTLALSWRADLPDPVAVHFDGGGTVDGYGSLTSFAVGLPAVIAATVVALWLVAVLLGRDASTRRWSVGTTVFLGWMGSAITVGSLAGQRGLTDARRAGDIGPVLAVALLGGAALGVVAALLVPRDTRRPSDGPVTAGSRIALGGDERAVWTRDVRSPLSIVVGGAACLGTAALALADREPWMLAVPALLLLVTAGSASFTATVDARGLAVRSALGLPRFHVPLDEVEGVRETTVEPFREFGGWGYRVGRDGRFGVVLRRGSAIEVERTGGRTFVVTVDDAGTGAALLATLAERHRTTAAPLA